MSLWSRIRTRRGVRDTAPGGLYFLVLLLVVPLTASMSMSNRQSNLALALLIVFAALFVIGQAMGPRTPGRQRFPLLAASAVISIAAVAQWGSAWVITAALTAVTAATVLPMTTPAAIGVAAIAAASLVGSREPGALLVVGGAGLIALLRARLLVEIAVSRAGRAALADAAVENERLRISRDLHDLLGHSLATMVMKAELAERLSSVDQQAAASAARDVQTVGRQAMVEVGEAVTGYRMSSLDAEIARARELLDGIELTVSVVARTWSHDVDSVLGWGVREAATNIVRHARATTCSMTVDTMGDEVSLIVVNDVHSGRSQSPGSGYGLRGLQERAEAVGGRVETERTVDGYRLVLTVFGER